MPGGGPQLAASARRTSLIAKGHAAAHNGPGGVQHGQVLGAGLQRGCDQVGGGRHPHDEHAAAPATDGWMDVGAPQRLGARHWQPPRQRRAGRRGGPDHALSRAHQPTSQNAANVKGTEAMYAVEVTSWRYWYGSVRTAFAEGGGGALTWHRGPAVAACATPGRQPPASRRQPASAAKAALPAAQRAPLKWHHMLVSPGLKSGKK